MTDNNRQSVIPADWATTNRAAAETGYTPAHMRRLARRGAVPATRVGRDWLVNLTALHAHKARMDALGDGKHSPWRDDLAAQGRGRARSQADVPAADASSS